MLKALLWGFIRRPGSLPGPGRRSSLRRTIAAGSGGAAAAVTPNETLHSYLKDLPGQLQEEAYSKLAAAGYAVPGVEDAVEMLSNAQLVQMGFESQAVRSKILKAIGLSGPSKTVELVDDQGTTEVLVFNGRRSFERWAATNTIKKLLPGGGKEVINLWEHVQDGSTYSTTAPLQKTVADLMGRQANQDKGLEDEVAECAVAEMREGHKGAFRKFCGRGGVLRNKRIGTSRQFDEIIVADNCIEVLEVKQVLDLDAAEQLRSGIEFIKQGIQDDEADFAFVKRINGEPKEIKGALGGMCVVAGQSHEELLKKRIEEEHWKMYVMSGGRFARGNSCHP